MGVIDKFLSAMKMNDDDDFEEDGYLDDDLDETDDYTAPAKRRIPSPNYDDDMDDMSFKKKTSYSPSTQIPSQPAKAQRTPLRQKTSSKVSPMRKKNGGMEVCVIRPKSMEDAREITETLLDECTVVLNMEGLELDIAQRIIDFASGSCYAIHGNLQKISNYIFIITPASVDISGDFQELLTGAFDVPAFGARY